jgi:Raf kinase inhibitor-like YbhB/YbcL family protein
MLSRRTFVPSGRRDLLLLLCNLTTIGCSTDIPIEPKGGKAMTITVTSTAFEADKPIPKKYSGDGEDISPPLAWSKAPHGTKEFALVCDDPDAPVGTWTHWVLYKIPPDTTSLPEGLPRDKTLKTPAGAEQGVNSWSSDNIGYRGPAPPAGKLHHYHFKLYALDAPIALPAGADKKALLGAIKDQHVIGQGELIGTYQR